MNYKYIAYTPSDKKLLKGTISSTSEVAAEQQLLTQGFKPIELQQIKTLPSFDVLFPSLYKVKDKDILIFSRQLATLIDAGVSIVPALHLIREETTNRAFKNILTTIMDDVRAGSPFSDAVAKHDKVFNTMYCQILAVGERTGSIADSLKQAATYMEKDTVIKKKIKKAMVYPTIVLVIATLVIGLLTMVVIPKLTKVLKDMNVALPVTTRMMMGFTGFISHHCLILLGTIVLLVLGVVIYIKRPSGRYKLDNLMIGMPVIGKANLMGEMARFSRTLALLVRVGLPLPETLEMARRTSGNLVIQKALEDVRTEMMKGEGLSGPMSKNKVFPRLLVQMVMVGEESGKLSSTLETAAANYEAEADDKINAMVALIEPAMVISLAVIVGFIAISTITPMFSIYSNIK